MESQFEKEFLIFSTDDKAQYKMQRRLIRYCGNEDEAEQLLKEMLTELLISNAKSPIKLKKSFESLFYRSAVNLFVDKKRASKKLLTLDSIPFEQEALFENNFEENESKTNKQEKEAFVLENLEYLLEQCIDDEVDRMIVLESYTKRKPYKQISEEFKEKRIISKNGKEFTMKNLRVRKSRALKKLGKYVEEKYPHFKL